MDEATLSLIRSAADGDRQAFSDLAAERWRRLVALARSIVARRDAEDVVQDALIVAWQRLDSLRQPAAFEAWLTRIVANAALHRARRHRETLPLEPEIEPTSPGNVGLDDRLDVQRLLFQLSPRQRAVMHLTHIEGCSDREIGEQLGISASSVRAHRLRARTRLAELITGGVS